MSVEAVSVPAEPAPAPSFRRWIAFVAAVLGIALSAYALNLIWHAPDSTLKHRLFDSIPLVTAIAMFVISWLIAWQGGRDAGNLAMALAVTVAFWNDVLNVTMLKLGYGDTAFYYAIVWGTFALGAALFIRASQLFPMPITAERLVTSPTIWGKYRALRTPLRALLRPVVLWPVIIVLSALPSTSTNSVVGESLRVLIVAMGIVYFYINYRSGDAEVRRKVLWFLAAAIATLAVSLLSVAAIAALGDTGSGLLRTVLAFTLRSVDSLAIVGCFAAAVFYAGAISPSLVIRKTVVFGLTSSLLLFVFASVEVFLHHQIVHWLEVTDTLASSLIGGAFGLTFHPVKHFFEGLLKRFHGRRGSVAAH